VLHVLHVSQQFPCEAYPALGVMVQHSVRSLAPLCEQSVLAPRPYTLPLPGFPYGQLALLPERRIESGYWVHRPRYLYPVPKSLLYPHAGSAMALVEGSSASYPAIAAIGDRFAVAWTQQSGGRGVVRVLASAPR